MFNFRPIADLTTKNWARLSACSHLLFLTNKLCPQFHENSSFLQSVGPLIGTNNSTFHDMATACSLCFVSSISLLIDPCSKTCAKSLWSGVSSVLRINIDMAASDSSFDCKQSRCANCRFLLVCRNSKIQLMHEENWLYG